jgi:hypothetical protein
MSPFKLTFGLNSRFEEASEASISRGEDSAVTLGDVLSNQVFNQEFDVIGILVEIELPKEFTKDGKILKRRNWIIADPLQKKRIYAIMWNDRIAPDHSLVGKAILLNQFILYNYNGYITLNSKIRSSVQPASHMYQTL